MTEGLWQVGTSGQVAITLLLGALFGPLAYEAQQAAKIARIAYLVGLKASLSPIISPPGLRTFPWRSRSGPFSSGLVLEC